MYKIFKIHHSMIESHDQFINDIIELNDIVIGCSLDGIDDGGDICSFLLELDDKMISRNKLLNQVIEIEFIWNLGKMEILYDTLHDAGDKWL